MELNPYQSPRHADGYQPSDRNILELRRKPWWGCAVAFVVGVFGGAAILGLPLAILDDAGGIQMMIGGFLGVAIYGLLFPLKSQS